MPPKSLYLTYVPLLFQDNLHQTAGTIESWNNIVKNMDSEKLRIRPDVFVARHKNDMRRQRAFYEVLKNNEYKVSMHMVGLILCQGCDKVVTI